MVDEIISDHATNVNLKILKEFSKSKIEKVGKIEQFQGAKCLTKL